MQRYFLRKSLTAAASVVVVWSVASIPSAAQTKNTTQYAPPSLPSGPSKPTPRTADGHPDLSGMWIERYGSLGSVAAATAEKKTPPRTPATVASVYPSDALPYQPWAAKK